MYVRVAARSLEDTWTIMWCNFDAEALDMLKVFVHVAALMCYHTRFSTLSNIHQYAVTCHVCCACCSVGARLLVKSYL
jgi:hypothetical protein